MPGAKLPILTITNKLYFRDADINIYSSADGYLDLVADTFIKADAGTGTIELEADTLIELEGPITLDGNTTLDTGHYLIVPNDGVAGSGAGTGPLFTATASGNICGWFKVQTGSWAGYTPVYSGNIVV